MESTPLSFPPSRRGRAVITRDLMMDLSREAEALPVYDEVANPAGLIDITSSINMLMKAEIDELVQTCAQEGHASFAEYGATAGTPALRLAVARFINNYFHPDAPVQATHIMAANGASALLDIVSFVTCDAGEAILMPTPNYGMFKHDLETRNRVTMVDVPCAPPGFDRFAAPNAAALVARLEHALKDARARGLRVRAMLLCNPNNPLGRCYSRASLVAIAGFCARHRLHLIADEIYAMSVMPTASTAACDLDPFTSILAVLKEAGAAPEMVHVIYGASKDFGLGGLRLGLLITRNATFREACRRLAVPTWVTTFTDAVFTHLLRDEVFLQNYLSVYPVRLQAAYQSTTATLTHHGVPFEPANAGLFIWVDLSRWLAYIAPGAIANCSGGKGDSPEVQLSRYLLRCGVYLQPGEAFYSLLPGRFRLVYSMDSNTRALGLQRLFGALEELQATDRARRDSTDSTNSVDKGDSHTRKKHIEAAVTPAPPSVHGRVRDCLALFSWSSRSGRRW